MEECLISFFLQNCKTGKLRASIDIFNKVFSTMVLFVELEMVIQSLLSNFHLQKERLITHFFFKGGHGKYDSFLKLKSSIIAQFG